METRLASATLIILGLLIGLPFGRVLLVNGKDFFSPRRSAADSLLFCTSLFIVFSSVLTLVLAFYTQSLIPETIIFGAMSFGLLVGTATGVAKSFIESRTAR